MEPCKSEPSRSPPAQVRFTNGQVKSVRLDKLYRTMTKEDVQAKRREVLDQTEWRCGRDGRSCRPRRGEIYR